VFATQSTRQQHVAAPPATAAASSVLSAASAFEYPACGEWRPTRSISRAATPVLRTLRILSRKYGRLGPRIGVFALHASRNLIRSKTCRGCIGTFCREYPYAQPGHLGHCANQPLRSKRKPSAGSRPRQQCRSGPQGVEEEDAARRRLPRDEAPKALRKALREENPGEGGSHPTRPQARTQKVAARRSTTDEAPGAAWDRRKGWIRSRASFLI